MKFEDFKKFELSETNNVTGGKPKIIESHIWDDCGSALLVRDGENSDNDYFRYQEDDYDGTQGDPHVGTDA